MRAATDTADNHVGRGKYGRRPERCPRCVGLKKARHHGPFHYVAPGGASAVAHRITQNYDTRVVNVCMHHGELCMGAFLTCGGRLPPALTIERENPLENTVSLSMNERGCNV